MHLNQEPEPRSRRQRLADWLQQRGEQQKQNLQLFLVGAGIFFLGAGLILWADQGLAPSIEQELIALLGLLGCIAGAAIALLGYLGLSLFRLFDFLKKDEDNK